MMARHHELPRFYLRDFCSIEHPGHLWVFERGGAFEPGKRRGRNNPLLLGINKACVHPQGYGPYESDLQREEHLADDAIRKVRALQPVGFVEKEKIARYIGLTWRRLRDREDDVRPILQRRIGQLSLEALARKLADRGSFEQARELLRVSDLVTSDAGQRDLIRRSILVRQDKLHSLITARPWRLMTVTAPHYFVTTDSPVVFDRSVGLSRSTLLFPIGRSIMLSVGPTAGGGMRYESVTANEAQKLNAIVIMHARRQVYSPHEGKWIHSGWRDGFVFRE